MPATKVRGVAGTLDTLRGLRRESGRMSRTEMLDALIKVRGAPGALIDVIDGLLLMAEGNDISDADYQALTTELPPLREWARGVRA